MKNPNGVGSVVKLTGKRRRQFAVRITTHFDKDGKQKFKYLAYFKTRKEALEYLFTYKKHEIPITEKITFKSLVDLFLEYKKNSVEKHTYKNLKSASLFYQDFFKLDYKKLTIEKVQYLFDCSSNNRKATNKKRVSFLNNFINFINKRGYKMDNFCSLIDVQGQEKKEKRIFTDEEINKLWENLENKEINKTIKVILILLYTGARVNEILKLKKENVNLKDRYIITGSKTEKGKNRTIPINKKIKNIIGYFYNNSDIDLIGISYSTFKNHFNKVMELLNMNHTIHETRHTFITRMRVLSEDVNTLQDIVGHTDVKTLDIYTHRETDREKMKKLIDLLD